MVREFWQLYTVDEREDGIAKPTRSGYLISRKAVNKTFYHPLPS
jgi:hypothetical protein